MSELSTVDVASGLVLDGCRVQPLSSYLKSIGLLRIVGTQVDPGAQGWFTGDRFTLRSGLDLDGLIEFLVTGYEPTPIVSPWNEAAGFNPYPSGASAKDKAARAAMAAIEDSDDRRLYSYGQTIRAARAGFPDGWWGVDREDSESKECKARRKRDKELLIARMRGVLPDASIEWLDAAVVLTTDNTKFPPLLGTGGNDGVRDFSSAFVSALVGLFGIGDAPRSASDVRALAGDALSGTSASPLDRESLGQFDPGGVGGPGSAPSGAATALSNPWDIVLLFEGAVAFASGIARRFGASAGTTSMPFMVQSSTAGYAAATNESSRGEFWAPVWRMPASAPELLRMIAEARTEFNGRQARSGADVARALASYGVDRGIDEFIRYAFLVRNGLATFAVPVGRLQVGSSRRVKILGPIDPWLNRLRSGTGSALAESLVRRVDGAMIQLSQTDDPTELRGLLTALADLERLTLRSDQLRDRVRGRLSGMKAVDWVPLLEPPRGPDDRRPAEFELAVALASLRTTGSSTSLLKELLVGSDWKRPRPAVTGHGRVSLSHLAGHLIDRIAATATVERFDSTKPNAAWCGHVYAAPCSARAWAELACGRVDVDEIGRWLAPLMLLEWDGFDAPLQREDWGALDAVPAGVAIVKCCFHHRSGRSDAPERPIIASRRAARALASREVATAIKECVTTLRVAAVPPLAPADQILLGAAADDLALAALVPVRRGVIRRLMSRTTDDERASSGNDGSAIGPADDFLEDDRPKENT